ncbi:AAA family ATPase [Tropicimonas sediminicola]|uniref:Pilus assembly protein CpaE n=1 Tax=Tropicimonas sediminicola TaxID=1031541 RepID=A0A239EKP7_9RHOB|nr:AAA family ATPase [Tropicimonas sediminicola]SNS44971.1 pilus assembly protein CpaE [Tropicimonas sediminicola]
MTASSNSIALVGFIDPTSRQLADEIRNDKSCEVEEIGLPLAAINGHAVKLAHKHSVILFRANTGSKDDEEAVRLIRSQATRRATIVALTEASASLQAAHNLTRAGADAVLPDTASFDDLKAALSHAAASHAPAVATGGGAPKQGRIISVAQARGGAGATTVAVNLADMLLSRQGRLKKKPSKRVAIVDLDLQFGAVAGFLDAARNDSLYQMASEDTLPDETFLEQSLVKLPSGLSVLPAPSKFAPLDALTNAQVKAILETLARSHDHVIVDMPRALVGWISPVLELSDRMLLVTDTAVPSFQQARRLIDAYTEDNLGLAIDMVVNFEKKPLIKGRLHSEAEKILERPLKHWLPPDPKATRLALDRGAPLSEVASRSPLTRAFRKLGTSLTDAMDQRAVARIKG